MNSSNVSIIENIKNAASELVGEDGKQCAAAAESGGIEWGKFTRILRRIGAVVLVCSAICFLLQRWVNMDSLLRYYSFLAFTLMLTGFGVFCGVKLREDKGARTFLAIAALFLPAHFAQLGALIRSLFIGGHEALCRGCSVYVRSLAIYQAPSAAAAFGTLALASAILAPIAYSGISSMARVEAKRMTALFLLLNMLLLLPTREPGMIALLAFCGFGLLLYFDTCFFSKPCALRTWDGVATRLLVASPVAVLLARSLGLYPYSGLIQGTVFSALAALLYLAAPSSVENQSLKGKLQGFSAAPATIAWFYFAAEITARVPSIAHQHLLVPLYALPLSLIFAAMSFGALGSGREYRRTAAWIAIVTVLWQLFNVAGLASSFLCIVVSIATVASAFMLEEKSLFHLGSFGLVVGLGYHVHYAADFFAFSPWLSLAITGVVTVIAASYLERNHGEVISRYQTLRHELDSWN
jgi:hypothetical protein